MRKGVFLLPALSLLAGLCACRGMDGRTSQGWGSPEQETVVYDTDEERPAEPDIKVLPEPASQALPEPASQALSEPASQAFPEPASQALPETVSQVFLGSDRPEPSGPVYEKEPRTPGQVTLSFAGDISFAEGYANMSFYHSGGDDITRCIAGDLIARMDLADILMLNNEFAYSDRGQPLSGKTFTFRAEPEMAAELERLSVDIVSLANNHVYDYGETALFDTLDTLDRYGIPHVGAGKDLDEAKEIVYFQVEDMRIAYVSATQIERSYVYTKEATETSAGVLRTYDPTTFLEVIQKAEETSDFVVVYVHWGTEGTDRFEADQRQLGYQYIDAGADLVIGDHPHCLQGIEFYKGVPIFYSLGNYWFNSRTLDTGLVEAEIAPEGIRELRFVPCLQKGCRTALVGDPAGQQQVFRYLESISVNAQIDEEGRILEKGR